MTKKIITTYTEYDEDGKIKSQSVTETPYPEDDCDLDVESIEDPRIDGFWELFQADMDALGYTQEVEE